MKQQTAKITNLLWDKQTEKGKGGIQGWETKVVGIYGSRKKKYLRWEEIARLALMRWMHALLSGKEMKLTNPGTCCLWYKALHFGCWACLTASSTHTKRCFRVRSLAHSYRTGKFRGSLRNQQGWGRELKKRTPKEDGHKSWLLCRPVSPWESALALDSRKWDPSLKRQLVTKRHKEA